MLRLLIAMIMALGLTLAPAADARSGMTGGNAGCTMAGDASAMPDMAGMAADHARMPCCTIACQTPVSPALLPVRDSAVRLDPLDELLVAWEPGRRLESIAPSALDPPPRA